jgi:hypothetical protein
MAVRLSALRAGSSLSPETSSGTYFCWRLSKPQAMVQLEGLGKLKQFSYLVGTRTRYLEACEIAPQLSTIPRAR